MKKLEQIEKDQNPLSTQENQPSENTGVLSKKIFRNQTLKALALAGVLSGSAIASSACDNNPAAIPLCKDATQKELDDCHAKNGYFVCTYKEDGSRESGTCSDLINPENLKQDSGNSGFEKTVVENSPGDAGENNPEVITETKTELEPEKTPEKVLVEPPNCGDDNERYNYEYTKYNSSTYSDSNDLNMVTCVEKSNASECHETSKDGRIKENTYQINIEQITDQECKTLEDAAKKLRIKTYVAANKAFSLRWLFAKKLNLGLDLNSLILKKGSFTNASRADLRVVSDQKDGKEIPANIKKYPADTLPEHNIAGLEDIKCEETPANKNGGCTFEVEYRIKSN